jgi:hypothetical protein
MTDTKDERIATLERENAQLHSGLKLAQRVTTQWQLDYEAVERRADALERERDALAVGLDRDTRSRYALIDRVNALERALRPFAEAVDSEPDPDDPRDNPDQHAWEHPYAMDVKVGDFQQARAALAQQEPDQPAPHDLYKTGDYDAPEVIKDDNGEVVLGLCRRCGRGEVDLEEPCDQPVQDGTVDTGGSLDGFIDDGLPEDHQPADQPAQDGERLDPYTLERAAQTQDVVNRCADRLWQIYPEAMPRTHSGRCNIVRAILEEAISNVQLSGQPTQDGGRLDPYTLNWLARRDDRIAKLETWGWEEHRIAVQRGKRIVREVERAEAAERRADALEGALRPFAEAAYDELDPDDPRAKPDKHAWEHPYAMDVKVGDFQHAAQVYYGYAGAVTDQPADAGEADKSVSLRQQISEAQEEVAAWPEWMTKSAKVHEASCCARAREAERERCAQVAYQQADYVVADDDKETSWDDGFRVGAKAAGRAIRRTDGNAGSIDE